MGGCLARPAGTRRVDVVRPARSEDARGKEDRPSHRVSDRLPLVPLDSALCIRGLVVYWAFGFDRRLDPDAVRASLAATLVKYPALAGRARVRARRGATLSLEVDLDHPNAGVAFEVRDEPATTLEDLRRAGPPSAQNNVTPSSLFRPLHIRCCENEGALCAVRLTRDRRRRGRRPSARLLVARPGRTDARCARSARRGLPEALARAAAARARRLPRAARSATRATTASRCWRARSARDARAFPGCGWRSPPSAFALARGACGVLGDVAPSARAGHRAHPRGGREGAQGSWTRRPRTTPSSRRRGRCSAGSGGGPRRAEVEGFVGKRARRRARPVDHRLQDAPPAYLRTCSGTPRSRRARGSRRKRRARTEARGTGTRDAPRRPPEKAAARRTARARRSPCPPPRRRPRRARAALQVFALARVSTATQIAARSRPWRTSSVSSARGSFPKSGTATSSAPAPAPAAQPTSSAPCAGGGGGRRGQDGRGGGRAGRHCMNVPAVFGWPRTPREMQEVVRALSDGLVPARGAG